MSADALGSPGERRRRQWGRHPLLAAVVRIVSFVGPVLLALAASIVVSRHLPQPADWWGMAVWWATLILSTLLVLVLADRVFQHAIPLAILLELSLLFPDRAPSRFRLAVRGGSVAQLRAEVASLGAEGATGRAVAAQRVLTLAASLAAHDPGTRGHSERVRVLTDMLAEEMRVPKEDRDLLRWASLLHDIGKLCVPGPVLRKSGRLDDAEFETVRQHPVEGAKLLGNVGKWLGPWAAAIPQHHERYDGGGYPAGLRDEEISLGARIVGLTDAFEAMTSRRSYTTPRSVAAARMELVRHAGTQFDPRVCRAFLDISIGRLWRATGIIVGVAQAPFVAMVERSRALPRMATGLPAAAAIMAAAAAGLVELGTLPPGASPGPHSSVAGITAPAQAGPAESVPLPPAPPASATVTPAPAPAVAIGRPRANPGRVLGSPPLPAAQPHIPPIAPVPTASLHLSVHAGSVHRGATYVVTGSVAGCAACTAVVADFGDGSAPVVAPPGGSFTFIHVYTAKGRYTVRVTVLAGTLAVARTTTLVTIDNGLGAKPRH